jgi:hypothetical protein
LVKRRLGVLIALGVLMLGAGLSDVAVAEPSPAVQDMAIYAKDKGLTLAEVQARYEGQDAFTMAVDELRALEPANLAWARWRESTGSNPVVYFVKEPSAHARDILNALPLKVDVVSGAPHSEAELFEVNQSLATELVDRLPRTIFSSGPSFDGQIAFVDVRERGGQPANEAEVLAILDSFQRKYPDLRIRIRVEPMTMVAAAVTGGGDVQ